MAEGKQAKTLAPIISVPKLSGGLNKLSLGQLFFAGWCSVPEHEREPWGMTALADHLGVARSTLYAWKRNPDVVTAVRTMARHYGEADYGRVLGAVIREAVKGSVAHARLYFELIGDLGRAGEDQPPTGGPQYFLGPTVVDERRMEVRSDPFADFLAAHDEGAITNPN